jgi:hypothetical protein
LTSGAKKLQFEHRDLRQRPDLRVLLVSSGDLRGLGALDPAVCGILKLVHHPATH